MLRELLDQHYQSGLEKYVSIRGVLVEQPRFDSRAMAIRRLWRQYQVRIRSLLSRKENGPLLKAVLAESLRYSRMFRTGDPGMQTGHAAKLRSTEARVEET